MRKLLMSLLLILSAVVGYCRQQEGNETFLQLMSKFAVPSASFRPAPLWTWNWKVTKPEISCRLTELKEQGFGGVFVHPRPGMVTEYLSEDWFELYRHTVEEAERLDMNVWIYDENSYPSGFGGGHVPEQMPESYNQGQGLTMERCAELPADMGRYALCLKGENGIYTDITSQVGEYAGVKGDYCLFSKIVYYSGPWFGGYSYVDLLVPGVTEKFREVTMEGYERVLGTEFGKTLKGIFTDEPNIESPGGVRWSPGIFEVFEKRWGYDLKTVFPSLFERVGNWKEVRHNYMETLLDLFIECWCRPWEAYCREKGLLWTGHYWEHGWPNLQNGPDNMAMYAWHTMPGIDMLFNQFDEKSSQAQFGNIRSVKELRSVANQIGQRRTLSETYGGGGWDVTFTDFKRLGDWEYALGVNFMNQHYSQETLVGARKYDYPPFFSYHSPWWKHYGALNDYFARLSCALSMGEQMNDILILEPTTTLWTYFAFTDKNPEVMEIGQEFQDFITAIEKWQGEYDLGCENIISSHGKVAGKGFTVGRRTYRTVVIPPGMENLNRRTFQLLAEFVRKGGFVAAFSRPGLVDGKPDPELERLFSKINVINSSLLDDRSFTDIFSSKKIRFREVSGGNLFHQRREYADGQLLFLVNSSLSDESSVCVELDGNSLSELDAFMGKIYDYPHVVNGGRITVQVTLPPAGSLLLFASEKKTGNVGARNTKSSGSVVVADSPLRVSRIRDNVLTLDFCDLEVNGERYESIHFADAAYKYYNHAGFPAGDPWASSVQYRRNIIDRDTITTGQATATYRFTIGAGMSTDGMKLVVEQPSLWTVSVNGHVVWDKEGEWWLDRDFGVYEIGDKLREGENRVDVSVAPLSIYAEIEPVYILGDFRVVPAVKGWSIMPSNQRLDIGSWCKQGLPFYSWEVAYTKEYTVSEPGIGYCVRLPAWQGTVAEVLVNGSDAGIIAFPPYELDITEAIVPGKNRVEVLVTGSHRNLLGPHHSPSWGVASPWHWRGVLGPIPAGENYQLLDYGLMEDFEMVAGIRIGKK